MSDIRTQLESFSVHEKGILIVQSGCFVTKHIHRYGAEQNNQIAHQGHFAVGRGF